MATVSLGVHIEHTSNSTLLLNVVVMAVCSVPNAQGLLVDETDPSSAPSPLLCGSIPASHLLDASRFQGCDRSHRVTEKTRKTRYAALVAPAQDRGASEIDCDIITSLDYGFSATYISTRIGVIPS